MKSLAKLLLFFMLMLGVSGCATVHQVSAKYYGDTEISDFKTYSWVNTAPQIYGATTTDKISTDSRIRRAVDQDLVSKGYVETENKPVDFMIGYRLNIQEKTKIIPAGQDFTSVDERTRGSLTIDILDPDSKQLIWRGSADAEVYKYSLIGTKTKVLEKAIQDILDSLPESGK